MTKRALGWRVVAIMASGVLLAACADGGGGAADTSADRATGAEDEIVAADGDESRRADTTEALAETEYRRGPDPTTERLAAGVGPFEVASVSVPPPATGFGGGTIYHPTDLSEGTFGAYVFAPGTWTSHEAYAWMGPRIASQGFVVFLIDSDDPRARPAAMGEQLEAALDYLIDASAVHDAVDAERLAVGGHSSGGGGSLEVALGSPSLQAVVALQPWHPTENSFPGIEVPTMIIGAENDDAADVESHAQPLYESIRPETDKAYLELRGKPHEVAKEADRTQAAAMIAWLKRYVDNDTRYEQFLCPPPEQGPMISDYRDTCSS
jgi:dienelactone hydrolase